MSKEDRTQLKPVKVIYPFVGGEGIISILRRNIPQEMIPTKKTGYIFGVIFLIVVLIGIITFPFGKMLSGNIDGLEIKIGEPLTFLTFTQKFSNSQIKNK